MSEEEISTLIRPWHEMQNPSETTFLGRGGDMMHFISGQKASPIVSNVWERWQAKQINEMFTIASEREYDTEAALTGTLARLPDRV